MPKRSRLPANGAGKKAAFRSNPVFAAFGASTRPDGTPLANQPQLNFGGTKQAAKILKVE
jgi:hypothetical protein